MATISTTCTSTSSIPRAVVLRKPSAVASPIVLGLPSMRKNNGGRVRCSLEKPRAEGGVGDSKMWTAAAAASAVAWSPAAALALVDERLSTEGTGLPFGLSNNLLAWILLGVFGLIWSFYIVYTSSLDEDEESGLSL